MFQSQTYKFPRSTSWGAINCLQLSEYTKLKFSGPEKTIAGDPDKFESNFGQNLHPSPFYGHTEK